MSKFYLVIIACVMCFCGTIQGIHRDYIRLGKKEITRKQFMLMMIFYVYLCCVATFFAYALKVGISYEYIMVILLPLWVLGLYLPYKKFINKEISFWKSLYIILISLFMIILGSNAFYYSLYLPYIKHVFN